MDRFRARNLEIRICGQAPSDHPDEIPPFLVECGISSISVTPDTLIRVRMAVGKAEAGLAEAAPRREAPTGKPVAARSGE